ncbi:MAG: hypothetical protein AB7N76_25770 [Planctomycetota bacterium]
MGVVYRVRDRRLGRQAALKLMLLEGDQDSIRPSCRGSLREPVIS